MLLPGVNGFNTILLNKQWADPWIYCLTHRNWLPGAEGLTVNTLPGSTVGFADDLYIFYQS
jgi:hypothetical protein